MLAVAVVNIHEGAFVKQCGYNKATQSDSLPFRCAPGQAAA